MEGKIRKIHRVFQVELVGPKEAITRASQGNESTKIWTDSLLSVMAVLDPSSTCLSPISRVCFKKSLAKRMYNGETGRSVYNVLHKVKTAPTRWQRPEITFVRGPRPISDIP
ncbi:hypothetical protein AVEN_19458-1 [Araneus ventricosus]|uniref:Uncharacterized protein n=1 Tax=Araneus ventricosus TaxID=182803 RepID=A0A4Y2C8K4_ARAVE|nr:hypothetical protein AVEN_19458-1 [Araneus ventricosus]